MYSIIVSNEGLVIGYSENLRHLGDGTVATSEHMRYAQSAYKEIVEVESLPSDYADGKYKYNAEIGFSPNEQWVDPNSVVDPKMLEEKIKQLESELALAKEDSVSNMLAITEVYELLLANNGGTA